MTHQLLFTIDVSDRVRRERNFDQSFVWREAADIERHSGCLIEEMETEQVHLCMWRYFFYGQRLRLQGESREYVIVSDCDRALVRERHAPVVRRRAIALRGV